VGARPDDLRDPVNSRQKGKRVERLWRDQLREAGFLKAFRGQQYCGAAGNADVVCPELPTIHFEVKGVQNLNVLNAMKQAIADAGDKTPVVSHKKNGEPWLVTMLADDWLRLVNDSDWVTSPSSEHGFRQPPEGNHSEVGGNSLVPVPPRSLSCKYTDPAAGNTSCDPSLDR
jgi:hypothetical protein